MHNLKEYSRILTEGPIFNFSSPIPIDRDHFQLMACYAISAHASAMLKQAEYDDSLLRQIWVFVE